MDAPATAARSGDPGQGRERIVIWRPQPGPQTDLLTCPVFDVLYGGARGGGKTDGMLGDWLAHASRHRDRASGLMVRRTRTELADTIERSKQLYGPLGFAWHEQDKLWRAPDGARLRFAYLERDADAMAYQGHSYTRVYVEEAGNFPSPEPIYKLMACLRSATGVPVAFRATANPGGPGHQWLKARYIDPAPKGYQIIRDDRTGLERVYIPARVSDNAALMQSDPGYVARLRASGSPELVRAWLDGDWDVVAGAYFPEWSQARHVCEPVELPGHWLRFRAMDWGSARPFSVGWYAVSDGTMPEFAKGALVKYREWYGCTSPNVGLRMVAEDVAAGIRRRTGAERITYSVADPAIFTADGGPSIAERMLRGGVTWRRADNARVGRNGAMGGWDQLRSRLRGDDDGRPMLVMFSTCIHTIRTLPALQHDEKRPEDIDTDGEDHAGDETRYAAMSRPWVREAERITPPRFVQTIDEMIAEHRRKRIGEE